LNPLTSPALYSAYKIEYTHSSDMLMLKTMDFGQQARDTVI